MFGIFSKIWHHIRLAFDSEYRIKCVGEVLKADLDELLQEQYGSGFTGVGKFFGVYIDPNYDKNKRHTFVTKPLSDDIAIGYKEVFLEARSDKNPGIRIDMDHIRANSEKFSEAAKLANQDPKLIKEVFTRDYSDKPLLVEEQTPCIE